MTLAVLPRTDIAIFNEGALHVGSRRTAHA